MNGSQIKEEFKSTEYYDVYYILDISYYWMPWAFCKFLHFEMFHEWTNIYSLLIIFLLLLWFLKGTSFVN